ncbi:methylmalonyl-CoA epimerase [Virgibacillus sp. 179-BFC.A HS]|uniref:Methylmalonyl-CoA epimerase n=1 Tax=Tigheibacillus jepli TaxID=3035914 RepID=A0ABU5CH21_9BACI|nr:methylmalonyl-CoA epimerase [Virgibacillus sp. 179-BFC.A HS]MDY0405634.1 methylmalonyl-CoA epimerase [Virgibacillus sp. 179-BFC.A HS]
MQNLAHIAIAVKSIEKALPFYTDLLGIPLKYTEIIPSEAIKAAFLQLGEVSIELMEPINATSTIQRFIDKRGEGIHHIAFEVAKLEKQLTKLSEAGVRLVDKQPRPGASGSQVAFIHPSAANGVLLELCQHNHTTGN